MFSIGKKLVFALAIFSSSSVFADAIIDAVMDQGRSAVEKSRDEYRHPQQTLRFFGIKPEMTVVEIWPGGGWYSNILAPLLNDKGQLYAAHFYVDDSTGAYYKNALIKFKQKVAELPAYKNVKITTFHPTNDLDIAPVASSDAVLTFRNIHNWYMKQGETGVNNAFSSFYKTLKKGGILGVVEHRLAESMADELQLKTGYMKQSFVIKAAEKAGFKLVASSEINANPLDNSQHPKGVWTLPPNLSLGEQDMAKYLAIGESNRMTLKFIKPE